MTQKRGVFHKLTNSWLILVIARLLLGGMMIYVSIPKLQDPVAFLKVVRQYEIVPQEWSVVLNGIAVIIPWIELLGGLTLIAGVALRGTGMVMFAMLCAFTTAISMRTWSIMQTEGTPFIQVKFDCGCGTGEEIIWIKLLLNLGLILLAVLVAASRTRRFCLSGAFGSDSSQLPTSRQPSTIGGQPE